MADFSPTMSSTYSTYHISSGGGPSPVLGGFLALLNATPLRFSSNHFFFTLSTVRGTVPVAFRAVVMFPHTLAFWFLTVFECFDCRRVLFCANCDTSDSTLKSLCSAMPFTASVFSSMLVQYSHRHCRIWDCRLSLGWTTLCEVWEADGCGHSLAVLNIIQVLHGSGRDCSSSPGLIRGQPLLWQGVDTGFEESSCFSLCLFVLLYYCPTGCKKLCKSIAFLSMVLKLYI